jgi:anhydro-N-acetylmuramic acid kinase
MSDLYIGLMSGTSADGIDAALVDFSNKKPRLLATHYTPYSQDLRQKVLELAKPGANEIHRLGELDITLAHAFADSVQELLSKANVTASSVHAIGSHGQTIRHSPDPALRYTLQIGDPNTIAARTGITTVADFRRKDIALGGQGAPLVPAFHHHLFAENTIDRAIVNIGGIANVTLLTQSTRDSIIGFDTGPGNGLLDEWIQKHLAQPHDKDGAWAASGKINPALLDLLLSDEYFQIPPPKSTGREYFNEPWLQKNLRKTADNISAADIQATLTEVTARSIIQSINKFMNQGEIYICGGGAHNIHLISRLRNSSENRYTIATTEKLGIHPDWVEAVAFAWLASQTMNKKSGNLPSVTGARQASILGGLYYA